MRFQEVLTMGIFDAFFKKSRREVNKENQEQGREGEIKKMTEYELAGYEVERTGHGHDFKAIKRDPFTGKVVEIKYVEVKTGGSPLSPLQRKKKRQYGKRYVVEHAHTATEALRTTSSRGKSSDGWFGTGAKPSTSKSKKPSGGLLGLGGSSGGLLGPTKARKTKRSRKPSGDLFSVGGSSGGLLGPTKARKTKRSRKPSGDLFSVGGSSGGLLGPTKARKTKRSRKSRGSLL